MRQTFVAVRDMRLYVLYNLYNSRMTRLLFMLFLCPAIRQIIVI